MKEGDYVRVNLGYKTIFGTVVGAGDGKYITVKHDNFSGEVFNKNQIELVGVEKELNK